MTVLSMTHTPRGALAEQIERLRLETFTNALGCRPAVCRPDAHGYPVTTRNGQLVKVSHLMLEATGRPRPLEAMALHSCANRGCIAPWHLRWGDNAENMRDRYGSTATTCRLGHPRPSGTRCRRCAVIASTSYRNRKKA